MGYLTFATGSITLCGMDIFLVAQNKIVLQANASVTVANSASYVDVGPGGVTISGSPMVFINGGGSKSGSASAKTPAAPKAPKQPQRFKNS